MRVHSLFIFFCMISFFSCKQNAEKMEPNKIEKEAIVLEEVKHNDEKDTVDENLLIDFSLEKFQVNGHTIFTQTKEEIISNLNLEEDEEEKGFKYNFGKNYFLINDNDLIVYFRIFNNELIITNPNLIVGLSEEVIKENFPIAYKRKTEDSIYDLKLESFELYDIGDNRIRIYLYQGKVYSIVYFMFEDPYDYPEGF